VLIKWPFLRSAVVPARCYFQQFLAFNRPCCQSSKNAVAAAIRLYLVRVDILACVNTLLFTPVNRQTISAACTLSVCTASKMACSNASITVMAAAVRTVRLFYWAANHESLLYNIHQFIDDYNHGRCCTCSDFSIRIKLTSSSNDS